MPNESKSFNTHQLSSTFGPGLKHMPYVENYISSKCPISPIRGDMHYNARNSDIRGYTPSFVRVIITPNTDAYF